MLVTGVEMLAALRIVLTRIKVDICPICNAGVRKTPNNMFRVSALVTQLQLQMLMLLLQILVHQA